MYLTCRDVYGTRNNDAFEYDTIVVVRGERERDQQVWETERSTRRKYTVQDVFLVVYISLTIRVFAFEIVVVVVETGEFNCMLYIHHFIHVSFVFICLEKWDEMKPRWMIWSWVGGRQVGQELFFVVEIIRIDFAVYLCFFCCCLDLYGLFGVCEGIERVYLMFVVIVISPPLFFSSVDRSIKSPRLI